MSQQHPDPLAGRAELVDHLFVQGQYAELEVQLAVRLRILPADGHAGSQRVLVEVCYPPDAALTPTLVDNTLLLRFYNTPDHALDAFYLNGAEAFRYRPLDSNQLYAAPEDQPWLHEILRDYNRYSDDEPLDPDAYPAPYPEDLQETVFPDEPVYGQSRYFTE